MQYKQVPYSNLVFVYIKKIIFTCYSAILVNFDRLSKKVNSLFFLELPIGSWMNLYGVVE